MATASPQDEKLKMNRVKKLASAVKELRNHEREKLESIRGIFDRFFDKVDEYVLELCNESNEILQSPGNYSLGHVKVVQSKMSKLTELVSRYRRQLDGLSVEDVDDELDVIKSIAVTSSSGDAASVRSGEGVSQLSNKDITNWLDESGKQELSAAARAFPQKGSGHVVRLNDLDDLDTEERPGNSAAEGGTASGRGVVIGGGPPLLPNITNGGDASNCDDLLLESFQGLESRSQGGAPSSGRKNVDYAEFDPLASSAGVIAPSAAVAPRAPQPTTAGASARSASIESSTSATIRSSSSSGAKAVSGGGAVQRSGSTSTVSTRSKTDGAAIVGGDFVVEDARSRSVPSAVTEAKRRPATKPPEATGAAVHRSSATVAGMPRAGGVSRTLGYSRGRGSAGGRIISSASSGASDPGGRATPPPPLRPGGGAVSNAVGTNASVFEEEDFGDLAADAHLNGPTTGGFGQPVASRVDPGSGGAKPSEPNEGASEEAELPTSISPFSIPGRPKYFDAFKFLHQRGDELNLVEKSFGIGELHVTAYSSKAFHSPSNFWIQRDNHIADNLMGYVQDEASRKLTYLSVREGEMAVGKYCFSSYESEEQEGVNRYRALILDFASNWTDWVLVLFIDYGNSAWVEQDGLCKMTGSKIMPHPWQSFNGRLSGLIPKNGKFWTKDELTIFNSVATKFAYEAGIPSSLEDCEGDGDLKILCTVVKDIDDAQPQRQVKLEHDTSSCPSLRELLAQSGCGTTVDDDDPRNRFYPIEEGLDEEFQEYLPPPPSPGDGVQRFQLAHQDQFQDASAANYGNNNDSRSGAAFSQGAQGRLGAGSTGTQGHTSSADVPSYEAEFGSGGSASVSGVGGGPMKCRSLKTVDPEEVGGTMNILMCHIESPDSFFFYSLTRRLDPENEECNEVVDASEVENDIRSIVDALERQLYEFYSKDTNRYLLRTMPTDFPPPSDDRSHHHSTRQQYGPVWLVVMEQEDGSVPVYRRAVFLDSARVELPDRTRGYSYKVRLVDHGRTLVVSEDNLWHLDQRFARPRAQAVHGSLFGISPLPGQGSFSEECTARMRDICLSDVQLSAFKLTDKEPYQLVIAVTNDLIANSELSEEQRAQVNRPDEDEVLQSVAHALERLGLALRTAGFETSIEEEFDILPDLPVHEPWEHRVREGRYPKCQLPETGSVVAVQVTNVKSAVHMYVTLPHGLKDIRDARLSNNPASDNVDAVLRNMNALHHRSPSPLKRLPLTNDAVVCRLNIDRSAGDPLLYHRAQVLRVMHSDAITVFLVDRGVTKTVSLNVLHLVHPEFMRLPMQAVFLAIAGVAEKKDKDTKAIRKKVAKRLSGRMFTMRVMDVLPREHENDFVIGELCDVENIKTDTNIIQWLMQNGLVDRETAK